MAEQWVARWKINKMLYEHYGGRLIFQQAGFEPIDAYRAQLRDIRDKGSLRIHTAEYRDLFDEFECYLSMGHTYLDKTSTPFFERPYWWETADIDRSHQQLLESYRAIPHR